MIALIQRVSSARVEVDGETVGRIDTGLLALIGIRLDDDQASAARLLERLLTYRVFSDDAGRMNRSLLDLGGGGLLLVPQFTLAAETRRGTRPGFSTAAPPAQAAALFDALVAMARERHAVVATGRFGANMQVSLVNDGPVTFWLES
ncbi:MAG: D-tyrosyl-tRNA(Tyr) deacylase [Sinobacteraceae bacterium]|nr:D-tyrosyl-tRNA(Tyr) deacylase [Nevskiaceae bacterium]MCP5338627.1 D-tyrosyl-tRNA(Tyr) deacylase [Nevskiaceae bacterium]MCP5466694.1 D-tyrosyl-tRNA(Tyr) deacylase [Nevskiaceae bacterium]